MQMVGWRRAAFTMIEAVCALAIIAFVSVTLLTLYPVGLTQGEATLLETRGAQIAEELFTSLRSTPYTAADCFGQPLDLSTIAPDTEPLHFYTATTASAVTLTPNDHTRYKLQITIAPLPSAAMASGVSAQRVLLTITPHLRKEPRASYEAVIVQLND